MIRFLADENVDGKLLQGCFFHWPSIDIIRAQVIGLVGLGDNAVLDRAAKESRVLLSMDHRTMIRFAKDRIALELPMAGLLVIRPRSLRRQIIEPIGILAECIEQREWLGHIDYVPF